MGSNLISVKAKGDIEDYFKHLEPMIISDRGAPLLARQLALHANVSRTRNYHSESVLLKLIVA